ncbi:MAG: gamma-glutamyl-gamma-aminobutyrate hydrolase family protein [Clostridiales bacterium]|nr:gamma-glutamyl-gamma-aminobutyrate hydrolase family protein [Clostridiales bacterium]MCD8132678.1 gamma-glutamyl-gamma-aminobutyrate hydrolase family protein [Clostridiales bacterium]
MAKKMIAVVPLWDDEKESIWMLPGYMNGIKEAGAVPIILPLTSDTKDAIEIFDRCDGLLLTGGHDVSPSLYKEPRKKGCGISCAERDLLESVLYAYALEHNKPVLGICRGIQLINVLQGGTLYQDLPSEYVSNVEHHMEPPYTRTAHEVNIRKQTPLYELLLTERLGVNSYHHQAIKKLGTDLEIMAESEDGLIEAVRHTGKEFVWAFQWHPEFDFHVNQNSRKIFEAFVNACQ